MKKHLFSFFKVTLVTIMLTTIFSSCTEEKYSDPSAYWDAYTIKVNPNQWKWDKDKECYYFIATPSWLGEYVANNGVVLAMIKVDGVYKPLQQTLYYYQSITPSNGYFFSETISYEYAQNYIRFDVMASDLFDGTDVDYVPHAYEFQIRLVW